jgi:hypothetical protein
MMLLSSLDMPPDRDTYATLPGLYNLLCRILSIMPPVLPILKHPGLTPPTVAGPMIVTFFSCALRINFLVMFSGIPSAIMAIVLICGNSKVSMALSYADRNEANVIMTSASGCFVIASFMYLYVGMSTYHSIKNHMCIFSLFFIFAYS